MTLNEYTGDDMDKSLDDFVKKFGLEKYRPPVTEIFLSTSQRNAIKNGIRQYNEISRCMFGVGFSPRTWLLELEGLGYSILGERKFPYIDDPPGKAFYDEHNGLRFRLLRRFWRFNPGVWDDGSEDDKEILKKREWSLTNVNFRGEWKEERFKGNYYYYNITYDASEEKEYCLYKHINKTNGKVYVGITKDICARWYGNGKAYRGCKVFYAAIQKYGWDNFEHVIIKDGLTKNEAEIAEIELIEKLDSTNPQKGYNLTKGGAGGVGYPISIETRHQTVWYRLRKKYNLQSEDGLILDNRQFMTWFLWGFYDTRVADYYEIVTKDFSLFKRLRIEQAKLDKERTENDTL